MTNGDFLINSRCANAHLFFALPFYICTFVVQKYSGAIQKKILTIGSGLRYLPKRSQIKPKGCKSTLRVFLQP